MEQEHLPVSPQPEEKSPALPEPEEPSSDPRAQEESTPRFRGLYRHVRISVRTLDRIIAVLVVVLVLCLIFGIRHSGYTVTFDANGGTDVPAQEDLEYGDYVTQPEPPTREGYVFGGWYADENLEQPWDFANTAVSDSMVLYARWDPE